MLTILKCSYCQGEANLDLHLTFTYQKPFCNHCNDFKIKQWHYYFCSIACLLNFLNVAKSQGINNFSLPCRSCLNGAGEPTGFNFGFEQNGICNICHGNKKVALK